MKIKGTVVFQKLGTGFWGILGEDGQKWQPVNMPDSLKQEGRKVEVEAEEAKGAMTVFMWGKSVRILKF
jgi:hypothetical protein